MGWWRAPTAPLLCGALATRVGADLPGRPPVFLRALPGLRLPPLAPDRLPDPRPALASHGRRPFGDPRLLGAEAGSSHWRRPTRCDRRRSPYGWPQRSRGEPGGFSRTVHCRGGPVYRSPATACSSRPRSASHRRNCKCSRFASRGSSMSIRSSLSYRPFPLMSNSPVARTCRGPIRVARHGALSRSGR